MGISGQCGWIKDTFRKSSPGWDVKGEHVSLRQIYPMCPGTSYQACPRAIRKLP